MSNPIPASARGVLYIIGVCVGILAATAGPFMMALEIPDVWQAAIVSLVGAITTLMATVSRANLGDDQPVYRGGWDD